MSRPEFVAPDLSGRRQRHLIDELHFARVLVSGQVGLDERLDFGRERAVALDTLFGRYVRLDHLPPDRVLNRARWTNPRTFRDREARGSNPRPPTNFEFKVADF